MEPRFVEKPEMTFVGIVGFSPDVRQLDISGLWERFNERSKSIKHQVEGKAYELHIQEETSPPMHFCLIGFEVEKVEDVPIELFAKIIPSCRYAVFTHRFSDGDFSDAFRAVYGWLEKSDYAPAHHFDIQCYDERFKGPEYPESVLEIYVPVKLK